MDAVFLKADHLGADGSESAWYSVSTVARWLGVTELTVRREIKRGNLAAIRVGKSIRVSRADLERYVNAAVVA